MENKGKFIAIEGGDRVGKSTQAELLKQYLIEKGFDVILTREPGGVSLAEKIRNLLLDPEEKHIDPLSELFLYEAARVQHMKNVILPALDENKAVICDRFTLSTIAYQGAGRGISLELIENFNKAASFGKFPTLTICIDADPKKMLKNVPSTASRKHTIDKISKSAIDLVPKTQKETANLIKYGSKFDRIELENLQFHIRARKEFLEQARKHPNEIKVVKRQRSIPGTRDKIKKIVDAVLGL
ncbi:MAG: dTMP kinase [Elusimicrobiota bacterium]|jgi:dTMP kinase|nr:dTMP kinase [Elusimicrobiota bacterium]